MALIEFKHLNVQYCWRLAQSSQFLQFGLARINRCSIRSINVTQVAVSERTYIHLENDTTARRSY